MNKTSRIIIAADSDIYIRSMADISEAMAACIGIVGLVLTEFELAPVSEGQVYFLSILL